MGSKAVRFKDNNGNNVYPCPYYPVGSIYLSVNNINPSTYFGGTWEQIAKGRTLVGVDTSQTEFNEVQKTGGEKTHTLSINEIPSHNHSSKEFVYNQGGSLRGTKGIYYGFGYTNLSSVGGGQAHNNLQPYFTCYIWLRIA